MLADNVWSMCAVAIAIVFGSVVDEAHAASLKPERIDVGVVRVGAIVECGVRVYWDNAEPEAVKPAADLPAFAVLKELTLNTLARTGRRYSEVMLTIDTQHVGEFQELVHVSYGMQRVEFPVSATIRPAEPGSKHVLLAQSPYDSSSTNDASRFDRWRRLVASTPLAPSYILIPQNGPVLRELPLEKFDVILLAGAGVRHLTAEDIHRIRAFATAGGRVILIGTYFMRGTVEKINKVIESMGLTMADVEFREHDLQTIAVRGDDIRQHPLTRGINTLSLERPSPIAVTDWTQASILVAAPNVKNSGYMAVSRTGRGELVVLAGALWWFWIDDEAGQHASLLENLLTIPVSAE